MFLNDSAASIYQIRCKICNDLEGNRKELKIMPCEGTCGNSFHVKCVDLPPYAGDLISNYPKKIFFKCDDCSKKSSSLPDVFKILKEMTEQINILSLKVNKIDKIEEISNKMINFMMLDDDSDESNYDDDEIEDDAQEVIEYDVQEVIQNDDNLITIDPPSLSQPLENPSVAVITQITQPKIIESQSNLASKGKTPKRKHHKKISNKSIKNHNQHRNLNRNQSSNRHRFHSNRYTTRNHNNHHNRRHQQSNGFNRQNNFRERVIRRNFQHNHQQQNYVNSSFHPSSAPFHNFNSNYSIPFTPNYTPSYTPQN